MISREYSEEELSDAAQVRTDIVVEPIKTREVHAFEQIFAKSCSLQMLINLLKTLPARQAASALPDAPLMLKF